MGSEYVGYLKLQQDVSEWTQAALNAPGIQMVPMLSEITLEETRLPGEFLGDHVDRMIVATARHGKMHLLSRDEKILNYSQQGHLNTLNF